MKRILSYLPICAAWLWVAYLAASVSNWLVILTLIGMIIIIGFMLEEESKYSSETKLRKPSGESKSPPHRNN